MVDIPALVHLGLGIARDVGGSARVTVQQIPAVGRGRTGILYGPPFEALCVVEYTTRTVVGPDGNETVTSAKLTFQEPWPVTDDDKFILPNSTEEVPVLKVDGTLDPTTGAPYAPVVWL